MDMKKNTRIITKKSLGISIVVTSRFNSCIEIMSIMTYTLT